MELKKLCPESEYEKKVVVRRSNYIYFCSSFERLVWKQQDSAFPVKALRSTFGVTYVEICKSSVIAHIHKNSLFCPYQLPCMRVIYNKCICICPGDMLVHERKIDKRAPRMGFVFKRK